MFFYYLIGFLAGLVVVFFYLRNQSKITTVNDVMVTGILAAILGVIYAFALSSMAINLNAWFQAFVSVGVGAIVSYKLFEKRK